MSDQQSTQVEATIPSETTIHSEESQLQPEVSVIQAKEEEAKS